MTRETKVGLLVGMAVILLISLLVNDFLAQMRKPTPAMRDFPQQAADVEHLRSSSLAQRQETTNTYIDSASAQARRRAVLLPGQTPDIEQSSQQTVEPAPSIRFYPPDAVARQRSISNTTTTPPDRDSSNTLTFGPIRTEPSRPAENPPAHWHNIEQGETLYHVAKRYYGDGEKWRAIRDANTDLVGDGGQVRVGARLRIPEATDGRTQALAEPLNHASHTQAAAGFTEQRFTAVEVTVQPGQSLSELARLHLGHENRWPLLLQANRDRLRDADEVYAGMKLRLPSPGEQPVSQPTTVSVTQRRGSKTYVVRSGDNLSSIARVTMGDSKHYKAIFVANRNRLRSEDDLTVGQELIIPSPPSH